jgi:RHS repeat-associated protein
MYPSTKNTPSFWFTTNSNFEDKLSYPFGSNPKPQISDWVVLAAYPFGSYPKPQISDLVVLAVPFSIRDILSSVSKGVYRYGYGSHEKIDEVSGSGNTIDMGDRWLDVRLGRTPKPDAKAHKYPEISPYAYVLNNPIIFVDPDGKVVVDPKTGEQVVKVNGQWQTASGGAVSKEFVKNTQPVLDKLTASEVGTKIYEELQATRTIVVIDLSDKENLKALKEGGNSRLRTDDGQFTTGADGLYDKVIITPDLNKLDVRAKADGIDFEEKLIQTMSVEKDHIATKEQIAKEKSYNYDLFSSPAVVEDTYGPLLQNAVKAGKEYRKEKGQTIDASSNLPIERVNAAYGSKIPIPED